MTIPVTIRSAIVDLFQASPVRDAVLTDEHPSSSYGLPVLVEDARILGSVDLDIQEEVYVHYTYPQNSTDLYVTDEAIRQSRPPDQVQLAQRAVDAGYPIANP